MNSLKSKKSSKTDELEQRLYKSATLNLTPEERRAQRVSYLLSIADEIDDDTIKQAEKTIDEMYK